MIYKVAIIGLGPAGVAAAVQLKRFGINFICFEKNKIGGLIKNANKIENFPNSKGPISGLEYVKILKKQIKKNKIHPIYKEVTDIKFLKTKNCYKIISNHSSYLAKHIILATGTVPKTINLPYKIFYEIKDLLNKKNKKIIIIGAGDMAFDYALNLSKKNKIILLNRGEKIKAQQILKNAVLENKNILYKKNCNIKKYLENNKADFIVTAIGRNPNFIKKGVNIHLTGDVKNGIYRQVAIANSDGLKAAMKINKDLQNESTS